MSFPTVTLTGHRPSAYSPAETRWVKQTLAEQLAALINSHNTATVITGMAIGADTWWAEAALQANLTLWAAIPFESQPARWSPEDRQRWTEIRQQAHKETIIGDNYNVRYLHQRNQFMIDNADLVVAVHQPHKKTGGTVAAIRYALRSRKPILRINPTTREITRVAATQ